MPTLTSLDDDMPRVVEWSCNTFVGRRMMGGLSIDFGRPVDRQISSVHAAITWSRTAQQWMLCDLGSTNGTWLDDKPLERGIAMPLVGGARVAFGDSLWEVGDIEPPPAVGVSTQGDRRIALDGVLLLPDERTPEALIYRAGDGWRAQPWTGEVPPDPTDGARLEHGHQLLAGGCTWTIAVPADGPMRTDMGTFKARRLSDYTLVLDVSADYETIVATLVGNGETLPLAKRRYHELWWLLALARKPGDAIDTEGERGWLPCDHLLSQLGPRQNMGNLNVWIHRSRKALVGAGFKDADTFFERRNISQPEIRIIDIGIDIRQH